MTEQDTRLEILNSLLTTPHRELGKIWPFHQDVASKDPLFYVRLAAWYADHGDVRDHKEMFIISLALSTFQGHRDVGLAMLRNLPPYEVLRVVDFIHGKKQTKVKAMIAGKKAGKKVRVAITTTEPGKPSVTVEDFGLFKNLPHSLKTEVVRYLREREVDNDWFDSTVLVARKVLKRLYALLHISPSERAQQILFDEKPPEGSRLAALKELARAKEPQEQATAILENKIPYRVATTVVQQMTPTVLLALIEVMSPQEVINNLAQLKRRGAMDNPELKALIEQKLDTAKTSKRVSALKTKEAAKAADLSPEISKKLEEVADTQIKAKGRIKRPTALLIDKSASMESAIDLGKRIGAMISAVCEKELYVYAFDTMAYSIEKAGDDLASWEMAMVGIRAAGGTSCGIPLAHMVHHNQYVEQIILVTDEGENTPPLFVQMLQRYRESLKADPTVCIVKTPNAVQNLEYQCRQAGIQCDVFQFTGDYYSLPNLVPLLARPSRVELLMEIMSYPLPKRKLA